MKFEKIIALGDYHENGLSPAVVKAVISKEEFLAIKKIDEDYSSLSSKHQVADASVDITHLIECNPIFSMKGLDVPFEVLEEAFVEPELLEEELDEEYGVKKIQDLDFDKLGKAEGNVRGLIEIFYKTVGNRIEFEAPFAYVDGSYESVIDLGYVRIDELKEFFEKEGA